MVAGLFVINGPDRKDVKSAMLMVFLMLIGLGLACVYGPYFGLPATPPEQVIAHHNAVP